MGKATNKKGEIVRRYGVKLLKQNIIIETMGIKHKIDLSFADGMIGAIPIFDTLENAVKYAGSEKEVFTIFV